MFELSPIIDAMIALYQQPRTTERFQEYLKILQGNSKDDMLVPIGNYNPMAKEHVLEKLFEMKKLNAEQLVSETIAEINKKAAAGSTGKFKVSIALADDLKGAWTNHYTTDYDSKFKLNALVTRNFCTPLFWSSEEYTPELIQKRTLEACLRTMYWLNAPKPVTLADHIKQEVFVAEKSFSKKTIVSCDLEMLNEYFNQHKETDRYEIIFNFLYGDTACKQLEFPVFGIKDGFAGFKYAQLLSIKNKKEYYFKMQSLLERHCGDEAISILSF